ncbi:TPA: hypothetical protein NK990_003874 [Vibrio parahaemolyticus]|nr:hypothetical protein [Vibrio parahaemolyticus]
MPSFVSIESPKLGSAVQVNNEETNTVVSVEQSAFGSVAQIIENEIINVYELDNTDIQSYYNEVSRQHSEDAQAAQLAAEAAQSAAETAESNAKASELDAEAAQVAAETAQSKAETAQSLSEAARNASQTAQSLSETAQAAAELAESNAKSSELDAEAAQVAAETAQSLSEAARNASQTAQAGAELAESGAQTAQSLSETAQAAAELAESNAKASELDAEAAATASQTAQSLSETAQAGAELAKAEAETAQIHAETAQAAAELAETNAETAEAGSIAARNDSIAAKNASEAARDAAQIARTGAETAASNAQTSATAANSAKVAAQTAQANAETAQSAAETAEANAAASASSAAASASSASTDADRAEAAANTAVNTLSAKGDWDASTGVYPTPTANSADFYQISVAGTMTGSQGSMTANIGDQLYWNVDKAVWYKIDNTDHILSVNGQEGAVVLDHTDVGALGATQNAVSASKWQTARTLTLAGDATGAASIDGSSNVTLTVDVANDSHTHDGRYHTKTEADSRFANVSGDTFNGNVAISKGAAKLVLTESDYSTNNSGIDFKTASVNQNLEMIHEVSDSKINTTGGNGQALIVRQTSGSAQAGLEVEGEIFAKANQRVFHDAYHPNADKLTTARTINGTSFNGTANITTANWGTARTLTIGNTARSVNGSSNVSWSLAEIGAAPSGYGLGTYGRSLPSSILGNTALRRESGFWQGSSVTGLPTYGHSWKYLWTQAHSNAAGYWGYIGVDFDCTAAFFGGQSAGVDKTAIRLFADNYHPNADKWTAARTLTLAGDLSGSVSIDGSSNVTLTAAVADNSHNHTNLDGITKLRFGPGVSANDDAAIEWLGASNAGYLRFSTADDNGTEYMQFGDYDHTAQGGAFTQWLKMYRGQAQFTGNVSASTFTGALSGNASTASKWATGRTIKIGNTSKTVDGSANVTWSISEIGAAPVQGRVVNDYNSYRESGFYGVNGTGSNAPSNNFYGSLIVARNIDTGLQIAGGHNNNMLAFRGWHSSGGSWQSWRNLFHDTYHPNADKWTTARTLSLSGDASGSVSWDGSANATLAVTVADNSHSHTTQEVGYSRWRVYDMPFSTVASYRERVILLMPVSVSNTTERNMINGRIMMYKTGGNVYDSFDVWGQSCYNDTSISMCSHGQRAGHKLVTFNYGGVKWLGIKIAYTANPHHSAQFFGFARTRSSSLDGNQLRVQDYQNRQSGTVVTNAEINDSIADWNGGNGNLAVEHAGALRVRNGIVSSKNITLANNSKMTLGDARGWITGSGPVVSMESIGNLIIKADNDNASPTEYLTLAAGLNSLTVQGGARNDASGLKFNGNIVLDTNNYSTHLDGRYYTESESNSRFVQNSEVASTATWAGITNKYLSKVTSSGVLEVARYIDFHTNNSTADYDVRLDCNSSGSLSVVGGTLNGSFVGSLSGNASSATTATYLNSNLITGSGQDLKIRDKRALVGTTSNLIINYGNDYTHALVQSQLRASGEIISSSANGWRIAYGNYGFFVRNDGSNTYFMMTNSGDSYGSYNSLRPLYISNSSGRVTMGHGLSVSGGVTTAPITSSNTASTYSIASQGAGVYAVLWSQAGQSNYSTILIWDGSNATLNGDYGNGLVPAINTSGTIYSAASTNWKPKRVVKIG